MVRKAERDDKSCRNEKNLNFVKLLNSKTKQKLKTASTKLRKFYGFEESPVR